MQAYGRKKVAFRRCACCYREDLVYTSRSREDAEARREAEEQRAAEDMEEYRRQGREARGLVRREEP